MGHLVFDSPNRRHDGFEAKLNEREPTARQEMEENPKKSCFAGSIFAHKYKCVVANGNIDGLPSMKTNNSKPFECAIHFVSLVVTEKLGRVVFRKAPKMQELYIYRCFEINSDRVVRCLKIRADSRKNLVCMGVDVIYRFKRYLFFFLLRVKNSKLQLLCVVESQSADRLSVVVV